jgi:hypothetical protein
MTEKQGADRHGHARHSVFHGNEAQKYQVGNDDLALLSAGLREGRWQGPPDQPSAEDKIVEAQLKLSRTVPTLSIGVYRWSSMVAGHLF